MVLVQAGVAAGKHSVTFSIQKAGVFYFDFLEAAVLSDVPDAPLPRKSISPALDFDTNHSYTLPPARIMWIMDKLGYGGPMNEYLGVFWWNQRLAAGISVSNAVATFTGSFASGDAIFLTVNGTNYPATITAPAIGNFTFNTATRGQMAEVDLTVNAPGVAGAVGAPSFKSTQRSVSGQFSLTMNGNIGQSYTLLGSTDLVNWTTVTVFICTNSYTVVFDPTATNYSRRFYRISQ